MYVIYITLRLIRTITFYKSPKYCWKITNSVTSNDNVNKSHLVMLMWNQRTALYGRKEWTMTMPATRKPITSFEAMPRRAFFFWMKARTVMIRLSAVCPCSSKSASWSGLGLTLHLLPAIFLKRRTRCSSAFSGRWRRQAQEFEKQTAPITSSSPNDEVGGEFSLSCRCCSSSPFFLLLRRRFRWSVHLMPLYGCSVVGPDFAACRRTRASISMYLLPDRWHWKYCASGGLSSRYVNELEY